MAHPPLVLPGNEFIGSVSARSGKGGGNPLEGGGGRKLGGRGLEKGGWGQKNVPSVSFSPEELLQLFILGASLFGFSVHTIYSPSICLLKVLLNPPSPVLLSRAVTPSPTLRSVILFYKNLLFQIVFPSIVSTIKSTLRRGPRVC